MNSWCRSLVALLLCAPACERDGRSTPPADGEGSTNANTGARVSTTAFPTSPFSGPCTVRGTAPEDDARFEAEFHYDDKTRLIRVDSWQSDINGDASWRESWAYDGDRLVRHELLRLDPSSGEPLRMATHEFGGEWLCYSEYAEPLSRREEWTYDADGRVIRWSATGAQTRERMPSCVPSIDERYSYDSTGVEVVRWEQSWPEFVAKLPKVACIGQGDYAELESCDAASIEPELRSWFAVARALIDAGVGAGQPGLRFEQGPDPLLLSWSRNGHPVGDLSLLANQLPAAMHEGTCEVAWTWVLNDEGLVVSQTSESRGQDWIYGWGGRGLVRAANFEELEAPEDDEEGDDDSLEGEHRPNLEEQLRWDDLELRFDDRGRLVGVMQHPWQLEFDYGCQTGEAAPANPGMALAALAYITDPDVTYPNLAPPPFLLHVPVDPGQPMAAPGLWGSGRGLAGTLEPGGRYWVGDLCAGSN